MRGEENQVGMAGYASPPLILTCPAKIIASLHWWNNLATPGDRYLTCLHPPARLPVFEDEYRGRSLWAKQRAPGVKCPVARWV